MRKPCIQCERIVDRGGARGLCHKCYAKARYHERKLGGVRWSTWHTACLSCGKTSYPHQAHGYCHHCYEKSRYNPAVHRVRVHRSMLKRKHGMKPRQYDEMFAAQGGVCGICRKAESRPLTFKTGIVVTVQLAVDHDHASKKVRGLLCGSCNRGLGLFKDDPELLRTAAIYLEEHRVKSYEHVVPWITGLKKEVLN